MKKLLLSPFFLILIFSNSNAIEIDLNDPYYKIGWKNLENPENTSIIIPDANASIEIIETEIYLDSKENIKKRLDLINEQETNIEDVYERTALVIDTVKKISESDWQDIYSKSLEVAEYNYNHFISNAYKEQDKYVKIFSRDV